MSLREIEPKWLLLLDLLVKVLQKLVVVQVVVAVVYVCGKANWSLEPMVLQLELRLVSVVVLLLLVLGPMR